MNLFLFGVIAVAVFAFCVVAFYKAFIKPTEGAHALHHPPIERWRGFTYTRFNGKACKQVDIRGDTQELFTGTDRILLHSMPLGGEWVRYWFADADPEKQESAETLMSVMEEIGQ